MTDSTWLFIECCWIAWLVYWVIMAFATKRTVERSGLIGYRLVAFIIIAGWVAKGDSWMCPHSHSCGRRRSRWES